MLLINNFKELLLNKDAFKYLSFFGLAFAGLWIYQKINLAKNIQISVSNFSINGSIGNQSITVTFRIINPTPITAVFSNFFGSVYDSNNNKVMDLQSDGSLTIPANGSVLIPITGQAGILNLLNSVNDILNNSNQTYTLIGSAVIDGISIPVNNSLFNTEEFKSLLN